MPPATYGFEPNRLGCNITQNFIKSFNSYGLSELTVLSSFVKLMFLLSILVTDLTKRVLPS